MTNLTGAEKEAKKQIFMTKFFFKFFREDLEKCPKMQ